MLRNFLISILFIGIFLLNVSCESVKTEGYTFIESDVEFGEKDYEKITAANNALGFELLTEMYRQEDDNVLISPTSLMMALSMLYNGADGKTKDEIAKALHLEGMSRDELNQANASFGTKLYKDSEQLVTMIGNSLWLNEDYQFQDDFKKNNKDYYSAEVEEIDPLDEGTVDTINNWVKESTKQNIEQILDQPLDQQTVALLLNTLYFKGKWLYEFSEDQTEEKTFYTQEGSEKIVEQMSLKEELLYLENDQFQAVKLPYAQGEMSMNIYLPKVGSLKNLIESFSTDQWDKWNEKFSKKEGTTILPKFYLSYETSLKDFLKEMGIEEAFDHEEANFSKMVQGDHQIYLDKVKQKTFIEINEKGTEAAASTSIEINAVSAPLDKPFYMDVNKPFMFTITNEETNSILFLGIIKDPLAGDHDL